MFERTKKINGHEYRYLVKSVRIDGKMKQKFIKYLGKVIPDQEEKKKRIGKIGVKYYSKPLF